MKTFKKCRKKICCICPCFIALNIKYPSKLLSALMTLYFFFKPKLFLQIMATNSLENEIS